MPTNNDRSPLRHRLMLSAAHILIGLGLIFVQVFHTSSVFEANTNFTKKTRLERQIYFQNEDAIYMYMYNTLAEAKDFRSGFELILRDNHSEFLNTVNGIERYSILPEIVIAYLYKQFIQLSMYYNIPTVSCWERISSNEAQSLDTHRIDIDDNDDVFYRHNLYYYYDRHSNIVCEGPGLPVFFYLEITWYLGGLTLFTIYIFATHLSRNIFAGLCAALYYFCIHNDATRIHSNPAARENFAFPFIISQIYFLTVWIEQHNKYSERTQNQSDISIQIDHNDSDDRSNHFKIGFLTAIGILSWDFSTYIFASQICIILLMVKFRLIKRRRQLFLQNFILAHIMARLLANNIVKEGWIEFRHRPMDFDCSALITLLLFIVQKYPTKRQRMRTIEKLFLRLFLLVMVFTTIFEFISERTFQSQYMDILLTKLYLKKPNFSVLINLCRKDFHYIDFATLKAYNCLFVSKLLIVFMLTWAVTWLKRQREKEENSYDRIQRAKNYLLEDYLEEKKLTMAELVQIEGNGELQRCMDLLKSVKYDYDRYKIERRKRLEKEIKEKPLLERSAFLNEVKRFKEEISEKEQIADNNHQIESKKVNDNLLDDSDALVEEEEEEENEEEYREEGEEQEEEEYSYNVENKKSQDGENSEDIPNWRCFFKIERPAYFYVLMQTGVFIIMAFLLYKLKFILTPFLCIIAATFPPKSLLPRNFNLWLIYAIVVGSCMLDRGLQNIRDQYKLNDSIRVNDNAERNDLYDMLKWIKSNTDKSDVFAGPNDIIGLVLLSTGRPISNNPLGNHLQMKKRVKIFYSMMSKRDSNSVYVQLAELKIDYIIVSHRDCFDYKKCKISSIWDVIEPQHQNNIQLCADLFQRANLNFLKIFVNDHYMILKIFERFQVDLNLIHTQMQEKSI